VMDIKEMKHCGKTRDKGKEAKEAKEMKETR